jgi:PHP family Zn ribbon phosphoesterase
MNYKGTIKQLREQHKTLQEIVADYDDVCRRENIGYIDVEIPGFNERYHEARKRRNEVEMVLFVLVATKEAEDDVEELLRDIAPRLEEIRGRILELRLSQCS